MTKWCWFRSIGIFLNTLRGTLKNERQDPKICTELYCFLVSENGI